jgi:hypothetical protein
MAAISAGPVNRADLREGRRDRRVQQNQSGTRKVAVVISRARF